MSVQPSDKERPEKVGVIVIHGVGPTTEGWINTYLVPELEKWSAYDRVAGLARKDQTNELVLPVQARDGKMIAIAVGNDDDFKAFCACAGRPDLGRDPRYLTRADRIRHRDELLKDIWVVLQGHDADDWLRRLRHAFVPSTPAFDAESEVRRVRDPLSSDRTRTWNSFSRRWSLAKHDVVITEMFWADMSHGGGVILTRLLSLIQLFLEAPFVLGRAFLGGASDPLDRLVRRLILATNWIMRWPIAGLNACVFTACFAAMALKSFDRLDLLAPTVIVTLLAVAGIGVWATLEWRHAKPGLADVGLASFACALLLSLVVLTAWVLADPEAMENPTTYLAVAIRLILLFWFVWGALNVLAVIFISLVGLKRRMFGRKSKTPKMPVMRPAAAVALGILIGIIWKLVLAVLGLLVIGNLGITGGINTDRCGGELSLIEVVAGGADACQLTFAEQQLINVRDLNIAAALLVALAVFLVVKLRGARMTTYADAANDGTLVLPRLIANDFIIVTLFAVALLNAAIFYALPMALGAEVPMRFRDFLFGGSVNASLPPAIGLLLFVWAIIVVAEYSDDYVHIGRDLVDHQYYREPKSFNSRFQARLVRLFKGPSKRRARADPSDAEEKANKPNYRRRLRIQRRLEALIEEIVRSGKIDRLIFFAHSQGTVILCDYLTNKSGLVDPVHFKRVYESLLGLERVDVLTMGSPLTHIYGHYYQDYGASAGADPGPGDTPKLVIDSWTNMWRVNDAIGQYVLDDPITRHINIKFTDASGKTNIHNLGIGPGGHMNYWKEPEVCAMLWALIENRAAKPLPEILRLDRMPAA